MFLCRQIINRIKQPTLTDIYGSGETEMYVFHVDSAQSDFEDIKTKCIRPGNNPFLDNFDDFAYMKKETNPFKTDIYSNEKTSFLYQEVDEPPEIDPSWFEMDEPELMEIFESSKNIFSVLDNPSENDFATNPFLARNPFELTNNNPFKESIIANNNTVSGIPNEQKMTELNTCSCPNQDNLTLVASRPNHYLKRKVNKVASWLKSRNMVTNSPCYLKLKYGHINSFCYFDGSKASISHSLKTYYLHYQLVVPDLESRFVISVLQDIPKRSVTSAVPDSSS
ncbi:hypothetical protein HNY73_000141 [Argiope bruennichi]|uniref:Uncharacterized protein n=1 Tax=Argiope bruennichi TaxID=94029 RepID=A0A8T0G1H3_ARGBR|nr:hypothetical protein HNY73_000141 [Argiope bruennichi]